MGGFYRRFRGTAGATGVVTMRHDPDFSNGKDTWSAWLATMGVRHMQLQIEALDGTVELQGCNGDPGTSAEWFTIEELTADGRIVVTDDPIDYIRINKTAHTSGDLIAMLTLEA